MIAYLDSSVLLRVVLGQRDALPERTKISAGVSSALTEVECLRTIDRLRLRGGYSDAVLAERREAVYRLVESIEVIELAGAVLSRAAQPLPTALGTLDAIHLSSALLWKERFVKPLTLATHVLARATAARASGLPTLGV